MTITAIDDEGRPANPVTLLLEARAGAHFNSQDLENGNSEKGLSGRAGDGEGNWRLKLETNLEIEYLAYIRTVDGFVTNMHEVAAERYRRDRIAITCRSSIRAAIRPRKANCA